MSVIYPSMVIRSQAEAIELLQQENQQLKERINKIDKHVSGLSSVGRNCEIYADVKREILKVVRGDNK